jgi:hypothetical protein
MHTMFLNNTLHFGMRTRLEHIELKWGGDIELNKGNNKITELRTILQRESQNS